jgi:hypothetical protein
MVKFPRHLSSGLSVPKRKEDKQKFKKVAVIPFSLKEGMM